MSGISIEVEIAAPIQVVWASVEDIGSHVEWMADAESITFETAQVTGVGTTFVCETRIGPMRTSDRMRVTAWEPPGRMSVEHKGLFTGSGTFSLAARGAQRTLFTWTEEIRFPWYFAGPIGAAVARPVLRAVWRGNLRRLADRIESAPSHRT